jgi:hypothetical protein
MRKPYVLIPSLLLVGCATTGLGTKATSQWPGEAAVNKRRTDILDASKAAIDCLKAKPGEQPPKGGYFEVTATADGKLSARTISWDGPPEAAQCVVQKAAATTLEPLPGPSVATVWQFLPPGAASPPAPDPQAFESQLAPVQSNAQGEVESCAQRNLPPEFYAEIVVAFFVGPGGKAFAPTVVKSTSNDGNYDVCVQQVIEHTKFPDIAKEIPMPLSLKFAVGLKGSNYRKE